jgi:hypothetical protein
MKIPAKAAYVVSGVQNIITNKNKSLLTSSCESHLIIPVCDMHIYADVIQPKRVHSSFCGCGFHCRGGGLLENILGRKRELITMYLETWLTIALQSASNETFF